MDKESIDKDSHKAAQVNEVDPDLMERANKIVGNFPIFDVGVFQGFTRVIACFAQEVRNETTIAVRDEETWIEIKNQKEWLDTGQELKKERQAREEASQALLEEKALADELGKALKFFHAEGNEGEKSSGCLVCKALEAHRQSRTEQSEDRKAREK